MQQRYQHIVHDHYETTIHKEQKLVHTRWKGDITIRTIADYMNEIWKREELREFNECIDFREAREVELTSVEIRMLAEQAVRNSAQWNPTRLAFIVKDKLMFGLGRMYASFREVLETSSREVQIFYDPDEAMQWVKNMDRKK